MRKTLTIISITLCLMGMLQRHPQAAPMEGNQVEAAAALRTWLTSDFACFDSHPERMRALVRFYKNRRFQPAWMGPDGILPQGAAILKILNGTWDDSLKELNAYVHHLEMILMDGMQSKPFYSSFPIEALLQAEVGMTQIALHFASLQNADHQYLDVNTPGLVRSQQHQIASKLVNALPGTHWEALVEASSPGQQPYLALKRALARYTTIMQLGGWPDIADGVTLRIGKKDPRVPALRKRLIISGDMGLDKLGLDEVFDESLDEGVRNFQRRHGLTTDGAVGHRTVRQLNVRVEDRIEQIKLNMSRWHRMPDHLGPRYVLVNIPAFRLDVVEKNLVVHSMRAIVGRNERRTPVLSAMMTYLEINPFWNIPQKIAREDILPKIHNDPRFLLRQRIQVFDSWKTGAPLLDPLTIDWQRYSETYFPFRLRQEPVAINALGRVKFMFPNRFSVYIHDTPARSLFDKLDRTFSSGCVRIEKPMGLASYLLAGQRWNRDKLANKVKARNREVVVLKDPIAVHLVYLTAWVDDQGRVHFYKDVYGRDKHDLATLQCSGSEPIPRFWADLIAEMGFKRGHSAIGEVTQKAIDKTS